ncbi:MAG: type II CAAX endopeptidase family protein [Fimbriimonadaceae bacterium]|nr:type II CAAX endopeptidase family protein [Fimbriimonadaceae bacterium]
MQSAAIPGVEDEQKPKIPRNPIGGIILALLLAFSLYSALSTYLGATKPASPTKPKPVAQSVSANTLIAVDLIVAMESLGGPSVRRQSRSSLRPVLIELDAAAKRRNAAAARAAVSLDYDLNGKVSPERLKRLGTTPRDANLRRLYASKTIPAAEAAKIERSVADGTVFGRLAVIAAREKSGVKDARKSLLDPGRAIRAMVGIGLVLMVLMCSVMAWIAFLILRQTGQLTPQTLPSEMADGSGTPGYRRDRMMTLGAMIFAAFQGLQLALAPVPDRFQTLALAVAMLTVTLLLVRYGPVRVIDLGLKHPEAWGGRMIAFGLGMFAMELPLAIAVGAVGREVFKHLPEPSHPASQAIMTNSDPVQIAAMVIFGAIVAPIWEEIVFRAILFPCMRTRWMPRALAAILSSVIFAAIHPQGIPIWGALATVGCASCALVTYTRSLVPSITMHMAHNATILLVTLLIAR